MVLLGVGNIHTERDHERKRVASCELVGLENERVRVRLRTVTVLVRVEYVHNRVGHNRALWQDRPNYFKRVRAYVKSRYFTASNGQGWHS